MAIIRSDLKKLEQRLAAVDSGNVNFYVVFLAKDGRWQDKPGEWHEASEPMPAADLTVKVSYGNWRHHDTPLYE